MTVKIAVLFDGAGLARLGLEQAGHECTGFELNPVAHYLSAFVGSGNCVLADVRDVDLSDFEGVWASPPCQRRSTAGRLARAADSPYNADLYDWARGIASSLLWVENVWTPGDAWCWNAAQFEPEPRQNRVRIIWGRYPLPRVYRAFKRRHRGICPTVMASEHKASPRGVFWPAARFYGRRLTVDECAYHQGFEVPEGWRQPIEGFTPSNWRAEMYRAIGNGVPVYMARAFGEAVPA